MPNVENLEQLRIYDDLLHVTQNLRANFLQAHGQLLQVRRRVVLLPARHFVAEDGPVQLVHHVRLPHEGQYEQERELHPKSVQNIQPDRQRAVAAGAKGA
jgi:hypothetical protein